MHIRIHFATAAILTPVWRIPSETEQHAWVEPFWQKTTPVYPVLSQFSTHNKLYPVVTLSTRATVMYLQCQRGWANLQLFENILIILMNIIYIKIAFLAQLFGRYKHLSSNRIIFDFTNCNKRVSLYPIIPFPSQRVEQSTSKQLNETIKKLKK